jgi:transcriptional regulator CtsR
MNYGSLNRKLKTLAQHISSIFQKNIAQKDIDRIIDMLFANKMISETNNTISYGF